MELPIDIHLLYYLAACGHWLGRYMLSHLAKWCVESGRAPRKYFLNSSILFQETSHNYLESIRH